MTSDRQNRPSDAGDHVTPDPEDPVLTALRQVEANYRDIYAALQERSTTVLEQLDQAREDQQRLRDEQATMRRELDAERSRAEHHRQEAIAFASVLKDIHRSVFGGSVFDLILKACLTLTGATRGVYVTVAHGNPAEVRAGHRRERLSIVTTIQAPDSAVPRRPGGGRRAGVSRCGFVARRTRGCRTLP